jgi:hypothetical protein
MKKIISFILVITILMTFTNQISFISGNNESIEDTFSSKPSQTSETSLSETYDDFRVNTSQTGMNRWSESSSAQSLTVNKSISNERNFKFDYNKKLTDNYTKFNNFTEYYNNLAISQKNWKQSNTNLTPFVPPLSRSGNQLHLVAEGRDYVTNYTLREDQPFHSEINFVGDYYKRQTESGTRDYSCLIQFSGKNQVFQIRDYHYTNTLYALQIIIDSTIYTLNTFSITLEDHTYLTTYDLDFYYDYSKINITGIISGEATNQNVNFELELDETLGDFYFRNYVNRFNDFDLAMTGYINYFNVYTYIPSYPTEFEEYLIFNRNSHSLGSFSSILQFNKWSNENTTSVFFFGLIDYNYNYQIGFLFINNSVLFYRENNDNLNITDLVLLEKMNFEFKIEKDFVSFKIESNSTNIIDNFNYNIDETISYKIAFILQREKQYDELNITLNFVSAPFKEALAVRTQDDGNGSNIESDTQFKVNFEGNESSSGYDERISYSYNIQDFSSISALLRAESNRHYNFMYLKIKISPIDSDGLINLNTDFPTAVNDYMIAVNYIHWWVSSTSGYMLCSFTDYDNNDLMETQINNAVSSEISFYVWQKNDSNTQVGLKYIEPIENDFTEGFDIAILKASLIFEKTKWMNVKLTYNYNNDDDVDTKASIGFNSIRHERGFTLEAPTLLSPATPTLYEKPTGFFASLIGFLIAPFVWLLGAMLWVVKAIFSLPELIIKGLFDLIGFIVGIIIPALWELYSGIVEWLFKTVPALEDIWEFLVDLLDLAIDSIITIFPIIPLTFSFLVWLIEWIIENVYPYAEYWMNKLINDTNTALLELFLIINAIALLPFFIAIFLKSEDIEKGNIELEDLLLDNLGYYISFWCFIYKSIISLLKTVLRLLEMIIGFIGGIIP